MQGRDTPCRSSVCGWDCEDFGKCVTWDGLTFGLGMTKSRGLVERIELKGARI